MIGDERTLLGCCCAKLQCSASMLMAETLICVCHNIMMDKLVRHNILLPPLALPVQFDKDLRHPDLDAFSIGRIAPEED